MSYQYEAAIVAADLDPLIQLLSYLAPSTPFAPLHLWLHPLREGVFVVFGRGTDEHEYAGEEIGRLARELSDAFGTAVAVFYNDQVGLRLATLFRSGQFVQEFGDADEVWVPYADDESFDEDTRYSGATIPDDVECECLWDAIDAALDAADLPCRIASERILEAYVSSVQPLWTHLPAGSG